jgi:hypothetical protein
MAVFLGQKKTPTNTNAPKGTIDGSHAYDKRELFSRRFISFMHARRMPLCGC